MQQAQDDGLRLNSPVYHESSKVPQWTNPTCNENDIAMRCNELLQKALAGSPDYVIHRAMA